MKQDVVTPTSIFAAKKRISPFVLRTPLEASASLSQELGKQVLLKLECIQPAGSFKQRGAFNKLLRLSDEKRKNGVIAPTAGNHGIGLGYAAKTLGVKAHIYVPRSLDQEKLGQLERNDSALTFFDTLEEAKRAARRDAEKYGLEFVSAYNDPDMIVGGGTIGVEIFEECPDVELVVVGMGGGGLAGGLGVCLKALNPKIQIWGVQPELNPGLTKGLKEGTWTLEFEESSIAEGLGGTVESDSITIPLVGQYIDRFLLVSEEELKEAMVWLLAEHKIMVEPSGAAAVAALIKEKSLGANNVVAIITGRNVSLKRYLALVGDRLERSSTDSLPS